ncbi:OmpP1/FadL family transporter [Falsirhodobacter xinxiangensis]|uniref:OmpP1/FadL family transporter n=1 Tax=Falsirhodobacter xinxiangensis TaxID=2530049 RepID=UPI0010AAF189|nr:outer membrane protein transport protein [Rhodobacter xinxiangensis]
MKRIATTIGLVALGTGAATAGGIDRSGQNISILFEQGRYAEFSFSHSRPEVSGTDSPLVAPNGVVVAPGGGSSGDVAKNFSQFGFAFKSDVNERLSYAVIYDEPFAADIEYGPGSFNLATPDNGGTVAKAHAHALTALLRWKFDENFSIHGGLRAQQADGHIALRGAAYQNPFLPPGTPGSEGFNGYDVDLKRDWAPGYVVGVAYERPEIALRVALTYQSSIKHEFDTYESGAGVAPGESVTEVKTPQSVNLDFQTGIMADTLLFGQVRWVKWSEFLVDPQNFLSNPLSSGEGLIGLDNTITYTLGVGRKFNDTWSGAASVSYEQKDNHLISPLAPTNGRLGLTLAAIYTQDNMKITTGVNYTTLGRAAPETGTPDTARADFRDNDALSAGVKVGFAF